MATAQYVYHVAAILSARALVQDWEAVAGRQIALKRHYRWRVPVCQTRWHRLPWHRGVGFPDCPEGKYG